MKKRIIKPFDIEKAKAGAEVCTRDGKKARIICFDRKTEGDYTIVALINNGSGEEEDVLYYRADGKRLEKYYRDIDLMLVEYEEEKPTLEPFQKVLVRDDDYEVWKCNFFSHYKESPYPFKCIYNSWKQCITYEGNEHLVGTTNNPE